VSEIVGEAVVRVRTDDSEVPKGAAAAGKKAGNDYSKGFKDSLKTLAGAAGIAFGAAAAVDFAKEGVKAATSFQDEMGALNVIIGEDGTAAIEKFSESSAQAFGISKVSALEAAHTFATFGKSAGLSGKGLAKFSTDFTGLAGDLASFNGGSTTDAIEAIGSALRGEAEPIRRYGVLLDDASLRASALRLGIIKTTKQALTPQQRVLAAQAEIWRQTKDAQGDSARTADSAANSQKRLTAQLEDLRLVAGQKLLPVVTDGVQKLSEFITQMQDGTGAGGDFVDILRDIGAVGQTILQFFDSLPGPVKKYGAELAIAALALSKVRSGLAGITATGPGATGALGSVGAAARNAGGAAGLLLIAQSAKETNTQLSILEATAGGALAGAALGSFAGPEGAAIGAGLGALTAGLGTLIMAMNETEQPTDKAAESMKNYTSTLDVGTNAITGYTRALAVKNLTENGAIEAGRKLGLSSQTVVNAALGNAKAQAKVAAASRQAELAFANEADNYDKNGKLIVTAANKRAHAAAELDNKVAGENARLHDNIIAVNEAALAAGKYAKVLPGIPKNVQTRIDTIGLEKASDNIVALTRKYNLTPKQVETVLRASGTKPTIAEIQAVIDKAKQASRTWHSTLSIEVKASMTPEARRLYNASKGLLGPVIIPLTGVASGSRQQSGSQRAPGGITTVGEVGRERVILPGGSRVFTAAQTRQQDRRIAAAQSTGGVTYQVESLVIQNPVPEPASVSQQRVVANTAFLLGV